MASIRFDNSKVARGMVDHVTRNIRLDFTSDPKGKSLLGADFQRLLQEKATEVALVGAPTLDLAMRQEYVGMLTGIADTLTSGIAGGFHPFNKKYFKRKARKKPGTEYLFWKFGASKGKRSATLAGQFRKFANAQAARMGLHGSNRQSKFTTVSLIKAGMFKNRKRYRYTLHMELPEITASTYRDQLFRQQFMNQEERVTLDGIENSEVFRRIMYNETTMMRPWIRREVRFAGIRMSQIINRRAKELFSN